MISSKDESYLYHNVSLWDILKGSDKNTYRSTNCAALFASQTQHNSESGTVPGVCVVMVNHLVSQPKCALVEIEFI